MESIKGRLSRIEKAVGAILAPHYPTFAEAHALIVFVVVYGRDAPAGAAAAATLAAYARSGTTSVTSPDGWITFDWSDVAASRPGFK